MLTVEKKAFDYAKENDGSFVVKTISASGGCCDMSVKDISIEFVKNFRTNKNYKTFIYNGIKVFIEKGLQLDDEITIYQRIKVPLIGTFFSSKGIYVKYI